MTAADTLARTIWGEARGEGKPGMEDVACCIMNRVAKPRWWGSTVEEVCLKPWQFSCWNANDPNLPKLKSVTVADPVFAQAVAIAEKAVAGTLPDRTQGATHYYDRRMPRVPPWAVGKTPCFTEGHHLFFNDIS
ncbi:cell wall hydrolase [Limnoglobus roseus]|uniref:Cell wall hydrolase n=1 Tax=Limnoglobus roseus TaxID=2598579 RepID=A0A5C1ALT7_9BACT|nr:cell wall hydrolase [Limnoglobus roseus]QEL18702.1 cell wall hydrolase [Limnoglobus roseus]